MQLIWLAIDQSKCAGRLIQNHHFTIVAKAFCRSFAFWRCHLKISESRSSFNSSVLVSKVHFRSGPIVANLISLPPVWGIFPPMHQLFLQSFIPGKYGFGKHHRTIALESSSILEKFWTYSSRFSVHIRLPRFQLDQEWALSKSIYQPHIWPEKASLIHFQKLEARFSSTCFLLPIWNSPKVKFFATIVEFLHGLKILCWNSFSILKTNYDWSAHKEVTAWFGSIWAEAPVTVLFASQEQTVKIAQ